MKTAIDVEILNGNFVSYSVRTDRLPSNVPNLIDDLKESLFDLAELQSNHQIVMTCEAEQHDQDGSGIRGQGHEVNSAGTPSAI